MTDAELKQKFDAIDVAIDKLFALHGLLSPRQAAMQPPYLRSAGEDRFEIVGGRIAVRPS